ncbi:CobW family GTP-binding protein [Algihabitans albus]|uniref:CobW family GTP-binding protein n=1 Tax=Algihabitans albus TaxID=2164067 RepID=UPI000E5D6971|nr:GTP-binding protein [Algihabitans albus]
MSDARIPVTLITGFLGSGKTTLLRKLLVRPELADTAVIVNELGDVGLDHELVETVTDEVTVLTSGCLCCALRQDLVSTLRDLYLKREAGEIPRFARVAVETTGLADPAPVLQTLVADPLVGSFFVLDAVVTCVDAVTGLAALEAHPESVKQAGVADRLLLTKTDLQPDTAALELRLAVLNPGAPRQRVLQGDLDPALVLNQARRPEADRLADLDRWLDAAKDPHRHRHHSDIAAHCLSVEEPLDWTRFTKWLGELLERSGADLLRVKGLIQVAGEARPLLVQGVQHVFHEPQWLEAWPPAAPPYSRLVCIGRNLETASLRAGLDSCRAPTLAEAR